MATEAPPLASRTAVVTGGAGLYGRHIVAALAEAGALVVAASRNAEACTELASALSAQGLTVEGRAVDLADEASIETLCRGVVEDHGRIDVLVNNAVLRRGGGLLETSAADWDHTSAVNSRGLFLVTRAASKQMMAQRSGSIVNVASIYGVVGPEFPIYEGTSMTTPAFYAYDKGGMIAFTRYLACLLGPYGVRANCLTPGGLRTPDQPMSFVEAYESRVPLGRLAGPEDIKGPVVFLASDASAYVTGINLPVDGGWTAR